MTLDSRIVSAVRSAVLEAGQDEQLAEKLLAWLRDLTEENETLEDKAAVRQRVRLLYESVEVSDPEEDDE